MKGQSQYLPLIIVPIFLIVTVAVFYTFQEQSQSSFEADFVNESVAISANAGNVANPPIVKITKVMNASHTFTAVTDYNTTETNEDGEITFGGTIVSTPVKVSYTGHPATGEGWTSFKKIRTGTYTSLNLAGMIPYIIAAVMVLTVILGAFIFRGA